MPDITRLQALIPRLAGHQVLVVGDVILDEYMVGRAVRMSREAPVPVLEFETRRLIAGGAANPAANIVALGSSAVQVGVIGSDAEATALREVMQAQRIDVSALVVDASRPTTVKTRLLAHMGLRFPQQVARMDRLSRAPLTGDIDRALRAALAQQIASSEAVLLSDYHISLLAPAFVETVRLLAAEQGKLLAADAQGSFDKYVGFELVKCNADEARAYLRRDLDDNAAFERAARELRDRLALTHAMIITRGADGATFAHADGTSGHCPAPAVTDVFDTVGAGDTAIAVLTLATLAGATVDEATTLANYASGLVVRRVGNYTPTPTELSAAVDSWRDGGGE